MHSSQKGKQWYFVMKAHIGVDVTWPVAGAELKLLLKALDLELTGFVSEL